MATDADAVIQQSKGTYKSFCRFSALATIGVLALLALMAVFLL
jgi:hypothetical protein